MTEREAFEAWALSALKQDAKRWTNHEGYVYLQSEWLAWQASRKQALEEAVKRCKARLGVASMFASRDDACTHNNAIHECLGAIRSLTTTPGEAA